MCWRMLADGFALTAGVKLLCAYKPAAPTKNGQNNATGQTFTYPSPVDFGFEGI
jgi:hypothetical protein